MSRFTSALRRRHAGILILLLVTMMPSACRRAQDGSIIGTFHMGEKVHAGPMVYTVTEAQWKHQLGDGGRTPVHRFLFLRVNMMNNSSVTVSVPAFVLQAPNGKRYEEVTEGLENVYNPLNMFRTLAAAQTEQGYVVFDAPVGAYKLVMSDAGEVGNERYAQVEIPVQLD